MATLKKFEDIEAWQLAREICKEIYTLTYNDPFSKDYRLKDQVKGSSGSMMDNTADGFERDGRKGFIQFLSYGKGSAGELRSQLYRELEANHITKERFDELYVKAERYSKMIRGLMNYLSKTEIKARKYLS
ncbi:MAG: four helix bundle protein [Bacteroidia bacterium]